MLPGETITEALLRIMEQTDGQKSMLSFDHYGQLDNYFSNCATKAASYAAGTAIKYVSADVTVGHPGYEELSWQVRIHYRANLFGGNLLAYGDQANHEIYMKFIKDFTEKLNESIQIMFPEIKVSCQTGYGGSKLPNSSTYQFIFYCKAQVKARMAETVAA